MTAKASSDEEIKVILALTNKYSTVSDDSSLTLGKRAIELTINHPNKDFYIQAFL